MHRYILKKALISFLMLTGLVFCQNIRVCINNKENNPVIHTLDIEEYLTGVLSKEMDALWPEEALKAQAVVSRTFAVYMREESRKQGLKYDIENSIYHQVYNANNSAKIKKTVRETEGEILTYEGNLVQVFFHSNCSGKTAKTSDVWGGALLHLSSVNDPFCVDTPYSDWKKTFHQNNLSKIFGITAIEKIVVEERDATGRVTSLRLTGKDGNIICLTGHRLRMIVNQGKGVLFQSPDIIPSANFNVRKEGDYFVFTGKGYGHGVGMCQWGAKKMAEDGYNYLQILKHYFPEMELSQIK